MTVYLEYDGKPVPIRDCSWLLVAPCGCVSGITVADGRADGPITTAEEALASFTPNAEQLRRDIAAGWTARLCGDRSTAVAAMVGPDECPHKPTWGEEKRPEVDGWEWAATAKSRRSHLVEETEDPRSFGQTRAALCGSEYWGWRTEEWAVMDRPTCRRCEAKARALGGVS